MTPTDPQLAMRLPVWRVLSELYLDNALDADDYVRIATVLAASPYSLTALEDILRHEVHPACISNLLSPAGEWAGFSDAWLLQQLAPRLGCRRWWRWSFNVWVQDDWQAIKVQLLTQRPPGQT